MTGKSTCGHQGSRLYIRMRSRFDIVDRSLVIGCRFEIMWMSCSFLFDNNPACLPICLFLSFRNRFIVAVWR